MSKSTDAKKTVKAYLLEVCTEEMEENNFPATMEGLKDYLNFREDEYKWNIDRIGRQNATREWLMGLALPIHFWNDDIVDFCDELGVTAKRKTYEKTIIDTINKYWSAMAKNVCEVKEGKF